MTKNVSPQMIIRGKKLGIWMQFLAAVLIVILSIGLALPSQFILAILISGFSVLFVYMVLKKPYVGLLTTIFLIPFQKTFEFPIVGPKLTIAEIAFFVTIFAWLAKKILKERRITIPRTPLNALLVGFLTVAVASMWNLLPGTEALAIGVFEILTFGYLILFFWIVTEFLDRNEEVDSLLKIWLFSSAVVGLLGFIGIVQMLFGQASFFAGTRVISTFRNPNALASYLIPSLLIPASLYFAPGQRNNWWTNRKLVILLLLMLFVFLFAASRGGFIGLIAGGLVLIFANIKKKKMWRAIILASLLGLVLLVIILPGQAGTTYLFYSLKTTFNLAEKEVVVRFALWRHGLDLIEQHPLVGVGFGASGQYAAVLPEYSYTELLSLRLHNTFLTTWVETGTLGLLFLILILGITFLVGFNNFVRATDPFLKAFSLGLLAGFVGLMIMGLTLDNLRHKHLWLVMALIMSLQRIINTKRVQENEKIVEEN